MSSVIKVDQIQLADGSTPTAADLGLNTTGSVLQVVQAVQDGKTSTNASSFANISGLAASITPSSSASKILIVLHVSVGTAPGRGFASFRVTRGSTPVGVGSDTSGNQCMFMVYPYSEISPNSNEMAIGSGQYLDSPITTDPITYQAQWMTPGTSETIYLNRNRRNDGSSYEPSAISTLTLMEIAG